ncbi:MAG: NAD(P)H-quinone oxidoreductase [Saprospiraceae bacterium]
MRAVLLKKFGSADNLYISTYPPPPLGEQEILVKVHATALNRADLLQREGKYPAPPGESEILGLEMAGEIVEVGSNVTKWQAGDRVCGLLGGGGYAELAVIHEDLALPIPAALSFEQAAAIPEVFLTAFQALHWLAKLQAQESVLIHAGASGVGTAAIQLAKQAKASVLVTASAGKHDFCLQLGADYAIDYQSINFETALLEKTAGKGVNVVIDFIGAPYMQQNLNVLQTDGRLVMLALMGGTKVNELMIGNILRKRLQILGSTLRARSLDYKIALTRDFRLAAWDAFEKGTLKPVVDKIFDWKDVAEAHRYMESNQNKGKIILKIS